MSHMKFDLDILACPRCPGVKLKLLTDSAPTQLHCTQCTSNYPIVNGVPQLLYDDALGTQLENIDYDQHHSINEERREGTVSQWHDICEQHAAPYGDVLEIGAGTGQLTWALVHQFPIRSLHACDISAKFINATADMIGWSPTPTNYYVCDANYLPFTDASFDMVVGHSVLHHFIDYPLIIKRLYTLLRPGGMAIFYEPVLQGKIIIAMMIDLMLRTERNTQRNLLDDDDIRKATHLLRHITKAHWIGDDRERLLRMEDKYVFDIHAMRALALECGYRQLHHCNSSFEIGDYKKFFLHELLMLGIEKTKVQKYAFIGKSFQKTILNAVLKDVCSPMGYFIFHK